MVKQQTFVYVDGTKGWVNVQNAEDTEVGVPPFIAATRWYNYRRWKF